ncbi:MAG: hypothetical protein OEU32_15835 [Acidimicrobiia bacterium]|nr:hypothetical protein [Acidimicrobiia bacterium]
MKTLAAGLLLGVALTVAVVVVVVVVTDDDTADVVVEPDQTGETGAEAGEELAFDPAEMRQLLEDALADTMGDDPAWAADTEAAVLEAFIDDPVLVVAEDVEVTCASELCRVAATVPGAGTDESVADGFLFTLVQRIATLLPRALTETDDAPDGALRFTVYLARAGYYLPTEGGGLIE